MDRAILFAAPGGVLLIGDDMGSAVRAHGPGGFRLATQAESDSFREDRWNRRPVGPSLAEVRVRWADSWDMKIDGYDLRFGERLIRRTEGLVEIAVRWEPELGLYVWTETGSGNETYVGDAEGHYRHWHKGTYIGVVRRSEIPK